MVASFERAVSIATAAHEGQTRMDGSPYINHPLAVAEMLRRQGHSEETCTVGVFHDVIEDTDVTLDDLRAEGYGREILVPLDDLTKRDEPGFYDELFATLTREQQADYVVLRDSGYVSHKHALSLIRCAYSEFPRTRAAKIADGSSNLNDTLGLIDIALPSPKHVRQLGKYGRSLTYLAAFPVVIS